MYFGSNRGADREHSNNLATTAIRVLAGWTLPYAGVLTQSRPIMIQHLLSVIRSFEIPWEVAYSRRGRAHTQRMHVITARKGNVAVTRS